MITTRTFWMMMAIALGAPAAAVHADLPRWVQGEVPGATAPSGSVLVLQGNVVTTLNVPLPMGTIVSPARLNIQGRTWTVPTPPRAVPIPTDARGKLELIPLDARYKLQYVGH